MIFGKHINRYYLKYAGWMLLGIAALVLVDVLQLEIPKLYRMVIDGMSYGHVADGQDQVLFDMTFLLDRICMPMVGILLAMVFCRFLWRLCFLGAAVRLEADLRNRMFDHAKDLSRQYYQVNKVGDLMSLFTNDLDTVQECFGWGVLMLFDAAVLGVLAIADMWKMNPMLTVLSMIPMGFLLASATIVGKRLTKKWDTRQAAFSKLSDFSQESFSGIAVIKAFVKEGKELWSFKKLNVENEQANIDHTKTSVLFRVMVTLFVESVICIILGYGGYLVYKDVFTPGQLLEFIGYFNAIIWPIMAVSELIDMTSRGKASLLRIGQLLDANRDVVDRPGVKELENVRGDIKFRDLTFRYPDGELDALKHVSFHIAAGESVGLVGKTGSGKTTLVDLLLRTYNVPDGTVFIDGSDVNSVSIRSVREGCAYVPQDNFLFSDTIENNIAFGMQQRSKSAVAEAARLADVDSNIRDFQLGYETVLGERGVTVSGGQKQRISIARALMKDAPILILDDSVSAVDTKTEQTILENLRTTRAGKTTMLIVAHRLSTIQHADNIILLSKGQILEQGSHQELLRLKGRYHRLYTLQYNKQQLQR
ncbi:MAG: ABC transporter ATP-binding protein [Oscillospiraceae bacterium]|nr:ABC transporter ATP-binding protein [Oscillospiraceae bacterium]